LALRLGGVAILRIAGFNGQAPLDPFVDLGTISWGVNGRPNSSARTDGGNFRGRGCGCKLADFLQFQSSFSLVINRSAAGRRPDLHPIAEALRYPIVPLRE